MDTDEKTVGNGLRMITNDKPSSAVSDGCLSVFIGVHPWLPRLFAWQSVKTKQAFRISPERLFN
jgi:hypothetical protein